MAEDEEEAIRLFVEDVELFLDLQDTILKWLDEINSAHIRGYDISEKIINLENTYPGIYRLFLAVFYLDKTSDLINKSGLSSEKLDKIFELKRRYTGLIDVVQRIKREVNGRINSWTTIDQKFSFDLERNTPQIEFKITSGDKQIFYTKDDIDDVYSLSEKMLGSVLTSLEMCQDKNISFDSDLNDHIKKVTLDIDKNVKKISEIIEKMEKTEKKVKKTKQRKKD